MRGKEGLRRMREYFDDILNFGEDGKAEVSCLAGRGGGLEMWSERRR